MDETSFLERIIETAFGFFLIACLYEKTKEYALVKGIVKCGNEVLSYLKREGRSVIIICIAIVAIYALVCLNNYIAEKLRNKFD